MELEKQVCSLELAQKLKTLGVEQESLWYWAVAKDGETLLTNGNTLPPEYRYDFEKNCSAFTVAELGEMLPDKVSSWKAQQGEYWFCEAYSYDPDRTHQENARTEADARAKCLIYLLENKLITL